MNMLELIHEKEEILNTKELITIDLMKDGQDFLENFEENHTILRQTTSLIYHFLKKCDKLPHNTFKFFIAAYYIVLRHPKAFPLHDSKEEFCENFGIKPSSLEYTVSRIEEVMKLKKILDDKNYPYYLNPNKDLYFHLIKKIAETKVESAIMDFYLYHNPINSQILAEELVSEIIFEKKWYPEELFRQFFDVFLELVEEILKKSGEYNEYVELQKRYLL